MAVRPHFFPRCSCSPVRFIWTRVFQGGAVILQRDSSLRVSVRKTEAAESQSGLRRRNRGGRLQKKKGSSRSIWLLGNDGAHCARAGPPPVKTMSAGYLWWAYRANGTLGTPPHLGLALRDVLRAEGWPASSSAHCFVRSLCECAPLVRAAVRLCRSRLSRPAGPLAPL